jgi:hypothetical protein
VEQPEESSFVFEWIELSLKDPNKLDGLNINHKNYPNLEASIYIGYRHNPCDVIDFKVRRVDDSTFNLQVSLHIDFEYEGVAFNEYYSFETEAVFSEES